MRTIAVAPRYRVALNEELFPEPAHITCRVCGAEEDVPVGHPALLCGACLADLTATARRVADDYAAALVAFQEAWTTLEWAIAESTEKAWWGKVGAARGADDFDPKIFAQAWARARGTGGDRSKLCLLWEELDARAAELEPRNAWYAAAERELKAARAALGLPEV